MPKSARILLELHIANRLPRDTKTNCKVTSAFKVRLHASYEEFAMVDLILLALAAMCQFVLGVLGFRVSTHPPKKAHRTRYEIVFIVTGLFGVGAIVWSGVRSLTVQETIAAGIRKIEFQLGIADNGTNIAHLKISIDNAPAYRVRLPSGQLYMRARVRYEGPGVGKCQMYLNRLDKDGLSKPIFSDYQFLLGAEDSGEWKSGFPDGFTFSDTSEHFYNVAYIAPAHDQLHIQSKEYNDAFPKILLLAGDYGFHLDMQGANCPPATAEIWVKYYGQANATYDLDRFKQLQ